MVGEPIALVVADSRAAARDAADRIVVDYDPLPVVIDAENAIKPERAAAARGRAGQPLLTIAHKTEGFDEAFDAAPVKVSLTIDNQRLTPVPIEPRAVVADWITSSSELTFYTSTQVPHFVRTFVAAICGVARVEGARDRARRRRRLRLEDQRARRGVRAGAGLEAVRAARQVDRDALRGDDLDDPRARPAADRDARGRRRRAHPRPARCTCCRTWAPTWGCSAPTIAHLTLFMTPGVYDVQHVDITIDEVFTNTASTDAYRGAGRPEATHLIERLVDALADELGLDPADVRRRNFITRVPLHLGDGAGLRLGRLRQGARQGARDVRLRRLRSAPRRGRGARQLPRHRALDLGRDLRPGAVGRDQGDRRGRGRLGVVHRAHAPDRLGDRDHGLLVPRPGSRDVAGRRSSRASSASRSTRSRCVHGDTGQSPYGLGTYGSRSLAVGGTALQLSCEKVRDKARLIAAHLLECSADDLEWAPGQWQVKGSPERAQDDPGAGLRRLGGRLDARRRRAEPRGDDLLRPAQLHVPVRHAHRRGGDRRRDRQGHDRALHAPSTTAAT